MYDRVYDSVYVYIYVNEADKVWGGCCGGMWRDVKGREDVKEYRGIQDVNVGGMLWDIVGYEGIWWEGVLSYTSFKPQTVF